MAPPLTRLHATESRAGSGPPFFVPVQIEFRRGRPAHMSELAGAVSCISADTSRDQRTGATFRNPLEFIVEPLKDQIAKAFGEGRPPHGSESV